MVFVFKLKSSSSPFSIKIPLHKKTRLLESTSKIEFELYERSESEKAYWSAKSMRDGFFSFSFVVEAQTAKVEYSSSDSADFGTAKGLVIKFSVLGICHERLLVKRSVVVFNLSISATSLSMSKAQGQKRESPESAFSYALKEIQSG